MICYVDDLLVTGKSDKEHLENIRKVLTRLQQHGASQEELMHVLLVRIWSSTLASAHVGW